MPFTKKLRDLVFPVYKIGAYIDIETNDLGLKYINTSHSRYLLDDTNITDKTYPMRRIQLKKEGYRLYPLKKMIRDFSGILGYPSNTKFIDMNGNLFNYMKGNKFYKLKSHKITKRVFDPERGSLLYAKGVNCPILHPGRVHLLIQYMGLLEVEGGYLLYNLTAVPFSTTRRKI
jgi:hypothetical protein